MASQLQARISEATKTAMKAREKERVATLRLVNAEIKRVEVDERREVTDDDVIAILTRMVKQRGESIAQYAPAGRDDLVRQEEFETALIKEFLPAQLSETEVEAAVATAISASGASSMKEMGAVMGQLKQTLAGRADMALVSRLVKAALS